MAFDERKAAYACDITYGTNSEFGFDYLRDNMAVSLDGIVQRGHSYAIVDEVDSILIDEARTPLIISGEPETAAQTYYDFARIVAADGGHAVQAAVEDRESASDPERDYTFDEKFKTVSPLPRGIQKIERALRHRQPLRPAQRPAGQPPDPGAQGAGAVPPRRRLRRPGRRGQDRRRVHRPHHGRPTLDEGLHQAVEAKEGVQIQEEHVTLATITLQNYFRLYEKLAGMTGTAKTEEKEFTEIYNLHVVEIPTNAPIARDDRNDLIFRTKEAKFAAALADIAERHDRGQPVLVGTIDVETSEYFSELFKRRGIPHNVLNAKQHEREAEIIKDAGQPGAVTISTNMAGRGVDIKLGEGVLELGGLYVVGTERHEARRIDNQLRGRSGRQGDAGASRFYLSGEDQLVRLFAGDRIKNIMARFKVPDDQPMEASILSKQIENAQKKVEEQNFVMRKNVLKYDDVMNKQRTVVYEQRRQVLEGEDLSDEVRQWIDEVIDRTVDLFSTDDGEGWDLDQLCQAMTSLYGSEVSADELREDYGNRLDRTTLVEDFREDAQEAYKEKEEHLGSELMRELERFVILQVVDVRWREHLEAMDYLREGVHLRSMAQKDPLVEYTSEGHKMFEELSVAIREEVVFTLYHAELAPEEAADLSFDGQQAGNGSLTYEHESAAGADAIAAATVGEIAAQSAPRPQQRQVSEQQKLGRNDPCWCGSGKKFKKCHGA